MIKCSNSAKKDNTALKNVLIAFMHSWIHPFIVPKLCLYLPLMLCNMAIHLSIADPTI